MEAKENECTRIRAAKGQESLSALERLISSTSKQTQQALAWICLSEEKKLVPKEKPPRAGTDAYCWRCVIGVVIACYCAAGSAVVRRRISFPPVIPFRCKRRPVGAVPFLFPRAKVPVDFRAAAANSDSVFRKYQSFYFPTSASVIKSVLCVLWFGRSIVLLCGFYEQFAKCLCNEIQLVDKSHLLKRMTKYNNI